MLMNQASTGDLQGGRPHAVIRADASVALGGGHVRRCLALADALSEAGWRSTFASRPGAAETVTKLATGQVNRITLDRDDEATQMRDWLPAGCELLVVDHYERGARFEAACRGWARRILVIDDLADRRHDCDVLIDQTPGRTADAYRHLVSGDCHILAGAQYALLDARFYRERQRERVFRKTVGRVMVNFGTADPVGATLLALSALGQVPAALDIDIVIGASSPHLAALKARAPSGLHKFNVHIDVDDMAALMRSADVA